MKVQGLKVCQPSAIQRTQLEWSGPFLVKAAAEPLCLCS
jgi:hypothetical protein